MKRAPLITILLAALLAGCQGDRIAVDEPVRGQGPSFSQAHGFKDVPFELTITPHGSGIVYYTLDGSVPTARSEKYTGPIAVNHTAIVRAAERGKNGLWSHTATASYFFDDDILDLTKAPEGYPAEWGPYIEIEGRAKADYAMDPVMTRDSELREKMKAGLRQIPVVSIVTDKGNLFNDSTDPATGGIYIHTGSPVGDRTGRDWERPISLEMFGGGLDVSVDCGIEIHGGHSRLAEKNPKHAFKLKFKDAYGADKLHAKVFGDSGPAEFHTLILRTFFGNSWQHWVEGNRRKAQYVRDMWARSASASLGMPSSAGRHVHVFLNGMYWGIYCLSEKIDEYFCQTHFGGELSDYEVIKVDEAQSNSVVADYGGLSTYAELCTLTGNESLDRIEGLLDVDEFIDYMILNQYGGNTDWDYHNWFAIRDRKTAEGFRFLVWDSEGIFIEPDDNVLNLSTSRKPTGIFSKMMGNPDFKQRFERRVAELSRPGGILTPEKTVAIWDSLYHSIDLALYCEAARWGDYRANVHPYSGTGQHFDVDHWYLQERRRLLDSYFPNRNRTYLNQLRAKGWYPEQ